MLLSFALQTYPDLPCSPLFLRCIILETLTMTSTRYLAKVLEKIQLRLNIEDLKINNNQHAFTECRSTVSALISTTQTWFNATNCPRTVHMVFCKAFDLVDHKRLLSRLALMNINKPFWLLIKSFLSGRVQQVNINGSLSSIASCPAGVPQGSVIAPTVLIFTLMIWRTPYQNN